MHVQRRKSQLVTGHQYHDASTLGCFIFSPFLKSKMLGSAYDGILATDSKYVIFFHYDVSLRWHLAFETPAGRKNRDFP